jgi:hypothetical protein
MHMMPNVNSTTGHVAAGMDALNAAGLGEGGNEAAMAMKFATKPKSALVETAVSKAQSVIDNMRAPKLQETRDELGRMLVDPEYARQAFEEYNRMLQKSGSQRITRVAFDRLAKAGQVNLRNARGSGNAFNRPLK